MSTTVERTKERVMAQFTVNVTVLDPDQTRYALDCDTCGPLVVADTFDACSRAGVAHLQGHGCQVPDITHQEHPQ